jgi:hypothetical protein
MAIIIRIDVDRPFGRRTIFHRSLSRVSSDLYFPKFKSLGYLNDLKKILMVLNKRQVRAYLFFRRCTIPSKEILALIGSGDHIVGLHLENSRNYHTFKEELNFLEMNLTIKISSFSKHGSGKHKYGIFHYAPNEPEKYIEWAKTIGLKAFFGNSEDPDIPGFEENGLHIFPSAFWLEPYWRDTAKYSIDWLVENARKRDIVLLFHPDNVVPDHFLYHQLMMILKNVPHRVLY